MKRNNKYTTQDTCCIIIHKCATTFLSSNTSSSLGKFNDKFTIKFRENIIAFNNKNNTKQLKLLQCKSTTLHQLQFNSWIGNIIWNKNTNLLTNNSNKPRLIYSFDCKNDILSKPIKSDSNSLRKPYINKCLYNTKPIIIVNRGYGTGSYKFNYCIVNEKKYFIENHLICLEYTRSKSKNTLTKIYNKVLHSFKDCRTKKFIKLYFGTNAMNSYELLHILPIYILHKTLESKHFTLYKTSTLIKYHYI